MTNKKENKSTIIFHGGAGHVTGANFLLDTGDAKILVDCGVVQGGEYAFKENYKDFAYNPSEIDALIVTHAHADHIGRIPKLVRDGFRGKIYSTQATKDLTEIMLPDALNISRIEAAQYGMNPLYESGDIERALSLWETVSYHENFELKNGVSVRLKDAGHILGSAMVEFTRGEKKFVFTGDLGNTPAPLLPDTEVVDDADYLLMESVYGDRNHEHREERVYRLKKAIQDIIKKNGTLLIPSFSMQRTQILLYEINKMVENGGVPEIPVYLDSPLATKVTDIFRNHTNLFNENVKKEIAAGDDIFDFPRFTIIRDSSESRRLLEAENPKIILSASGMSVGGRVLMHERRFLGDKRNIILFVGYQGAGTLGRRIQDGAKKVSISGKQVKVSAEKQSIRGFSAHKDLDNLVDFVSHTAEKNKKVFVTMGEARSSLFLVQRLREFLGVDAIAPEQGEKIEIDF